MRGPNLQKIEPWHNFSIKKVPLQPRRFLQSTYTNHRGNNIDLKGLCCKPETFLHHRGCLQSEGTFESNCILNRRLPANRAGLRIKLPELSDSRSLSGSIRNLSLLMSICIPTFLTSCRSATLKRDANSQ